MPHGGAGFLIGVPRGAYLQRQNTQVRKLSHKPRTVLDAQGTAEGGGFIPKGFSDGQRYGYVVGEGLLVPPAVNGYAKLGAGIPSAVSPCGENVSLRS